MTGEQLALALWTIVLIPLTAAFFFVWVRARQLQDAMNDMEGAKLLDSLTKIVLATVIVSVLTLVRVVIGVVAYADAEWLRGLISVISSTILLGTIAWQLRRIGRGFR